jgi:hypothetical protein
MRFVTFMLLSGSTLIGCQPKPETADQARARIESESAAARKIIDSLNIEFTKHLEMGHANVVAAAYTPDAHVLPPGSPLVSGREAIQNYWSGLIALKPQGTVKAESVTANGPLAVERGTVTLSYTPPGATAPVTEVGKYVVHWHNVDGKWLIADDIWNMDAGPAPPPEPAKAK